jgi:large subunit ribosomal protein L17
MRHRNAFRKLSRTSAHRKALYRNLASALIEHGRIRTTEAKAKELRRVAERLVSLGKEGTLHARRQALSRLGRVDVVQKLFGELAEAFRERPGGYTRVLKIGVRKGDASPMSLIEFVNYVPPERDVEA